MLKLKRFVKYLKNVADLFLFEMKFSIAIVVEYLNYHHIQINYFQKHPLHLRSFQVLLPSIAVIMFREFSKFCAFDLISGNPTEKSLTVSCLENALAI